MKRKIAIMLCAAATAVSLTGCGTLVQIKSDERGNVSFGSYYLMTDSEFSDFAQQASSEGQGNAEGVLAGTMEIDGVTYNLLGMAADAVAKEDAKKIDKEYKESGSSMFSFGLLSEGYFGTEYVLQAQTDSMVGSPENPSEGSAIDLDLSGVEEITEQFMLPFVYEVTLPADVYKCDASGVADGRKVTWTYTSLDVESEQIYAYTENFAKKHTPIIKGVKNAKEYKKKAKIKVSELAGFKVTKIVLDGKQIYTGPGKGTKIKVTDTGKHTVVATNDVGNTKEVTFTVKK